MNDDIEARLRSALASRAEGVEPATGAEVVPTLQARADAARRRLARQRVLLSVAAVVVVVAGITTALVVVGGHDTTGLATEQGSSSTATSATTTIPSALPGDFTSPAIWPLPSMSVTYATPEDATEAFFFGYLAFDGARDCAVEATIRGTRAATSWGCNADGELRLRHDGTRGWSVLGMEAAGLALDAPLAGATSAGPVVAVTSSGPSVELALRALGSLDDLATATIPAGGGAATLGPADLAGGDYVLVARSGTRTTVRLVHVTPAPTTTVEPTTTTIAPTTTTTEEADDGTVGWPGASVGGFDDPTAAATAFADQVLGFFDTRAIGPEFGSETDATVALTPRPGAGAQTVVTVHDTGRRGWVVTGATSSQGRIDTPTAGATYDGRVTGSATAFEAQIAVRLLSINGDLLVQGTATAGANGERGPFDTTLAAPASVTGPIFVLVGEGDASGEGDLSWAALVIVDA